MRISVACDIVEITQLCNNHNDDNDDNMMHACACARARVVCILWWFISMSKLVIYGRKR